MAFSAATATALALSGCVESQAPLITYARPLLGQRFEVHLYETFVDGKASDFHTSSYFWKDGQYVRGSGLARDAKRFVAQPLAANDFLLQSSDDSAKIFNYWIGRKLAVGVYMIFPVDETDADDVHAWQCAARTSPRESAGSGPMISLSPWPVPQPPNPCKFLRLALF